MGNRHTSAKRPGGAPGRKLGSVMMLQVQYRSMKARSYLILMAAAILVPVVLVASVGLSEAKA